MTTPDQLILEFEHRPSLSGDDFLISTENGEAVAWIDKWPDWPSPVLVIHGPSGCGKTHLCAVFRARTSAVELRPGYSQSAADDREATAFVFDGLDRHLTKDVEEGIFHLYNRLSTDGRHLLVTADSPPSQWSYATEDVRSRMQASPRVGIEAPGDELIAGVLVKLFKDHQLNVGSEAVLYMVPRMERSFDAARRLVEAIDRKSLAGKRRITVPLVREVLGTSNS